MSRLPAPRTPRVSRTPPAQRISGPAELLQAVPYLLGFHPHRSLVLVGLRDGLLVVTCRLDLPDAEEPAVVAHAVAAMARGGSSALVAAVYGGGAPLAELSGDASVWCVAQAVDDAAAGEGCDVLDVLLVAGSWWRSMMCDSPACCPPQGQRLPDGPSVFATAATVSGVVALPDREALAAVLDPLPADERLGLAELTAAADPAGATRSRTSAGYERCAKRALFAAARKSADRDWRGVPDAQAAAHGAALRVTAVRDAVWMAVDDGRLDGRALWRHLARCLPGPYDAAPLFLYGWAAWRAGEGAIAGIAAERAVRSDPTYSAADLLLAALSHGVNPRQFPRLRVPRSA